MASAVLFNSTMAAKYKTQRKQFTHKQNMKTLTQLLKKPNLTVKTTLLQKVPSIDVAKMNKKEFTNISNIVQSDRSKHKKNVNTVSGKQRNEMQQEVKTVEKKEYKSSLSKRNFQQNKIKLKPKHNYTVVCSMNKRKRTTPNCYIETDPRPFIENTRNESKSPSIEELIRIADENLTDEDFLEILTCPSPVWWESNEDYSSDEEMINIAEEKNNGFKGKSSKLENILGKIKLKKFKNIEYKQSDKVEISDKNNKNVEQIVSSKELLDDSEVFNENFDINCNSDKEESSVKIYNSDNTVKERTNSLSGLSDTSISEDLLKSLENIEIPVKENNIDNDIGQNFDSMKRQNVSQDGGNINCVFVIDNINSLPDKKASKVKQSQNKTNAVAIRKSKRKSPVKTKYYQDFEVFPEIKRRKKSNTVKGNEMKKTKQKTDAKQNLVQSELPLRKSYSGKNKTSKNAITTKEKSLKVVDSIPDSHIKYLDESLDVDKSVDIYKILPTKPEQMDVEDQIFANLLSKDRFTIEQSPKTDNKSEELLKNKQNSRQKLNTANKSKKANLNVASTKVNKYCRDCSSIFDTESCQYCAKKVSKEKII